MIRTVFRDAAGAVVSDGPREIPFVLGIRPGYPVDLGPLGTFRVVSVKIALKQEGSAAEIVVEPWPGGLEETPAG